MNQKHADVVIAGGGVAGLAAAVAFGKAGYDIVIVDPAPPITDAAASGADLRTTAFLQPAQAFLKRIGLWDDMAPHATPLRIMRIVDASGPDGEVRARRDFDAAEISDQPFGWNLPNWLLRRVMVDRLKTLPNVDFRTRLGFDGLLARETEALVKLTDGTRLRAKLVIGADGRGSAVRRAAGIDTRVTRYGQKAVTFAVTHDAPHDNISTEVHRAGGPFTLVPLPDHDGRPCSAVVWMTDGPRALALEALPEPEFAAAATVRSANLYGPLALASRRMVWPIISQVASRMSAARIALVAEAAHVLPPIGAQGLNMSLADLDCLLGLAAAHPLGGQHMLDAYHRARHHEVAARVKGIDALNRASISGNPLVQDMRAAGIGSLFGLRPVRRGLMHVGLGAAGATS